MSTKHTPGPWIVTDTDDKRSKGYVRPADGKIMQGALRCPSLAQVFYSQCPHGEAEANARLIAAAPELLAALKAWDHWYAVDSTEELRDDAFEAGRKAIAKAEGGSNV